MAQLIIEIDDEILEETGVEEIKNMFHRFLKSKEKEIEIPSKLKKDKILLMT
jgi:hypothetical protein